MHGNGTIRKARGSVTVFFAMAFLSIVAFYLALIYAANHCILVTHGRKMVNSSARSVLAEYDRSIEKKFGIYVVCSQEKAQQSLEFYLEENFKGSKNNIFSYTLSQLQLQRERDLSEISVLEEQIHQFMSKRIFISLIDEFSKSLGILQKGSQKLKETADEWEQLQEFNDLYVQLIEKIDGIRSDGSYNGEGINHLSLSTDYMGRLQAMKEQREEALIFQSMVISWTKEIDKRITEYEEAEQILKHLQEVGREITSHSLPLTEEEMGGILRQLKGRRVLLDQIKEELGKWKNEPDDLQGEQRIEELLEALEKQSEKIFLKYTIKEEEDSHISLKKLRQKLLGKEENDTIDSVPDRELLSKEDSIYAQLPSVIYQEIPKEEESFQDFLREMQDRFSEMGSEILNKVYLVEYAAGMLQNFSETIALSKGQINLNLRMKEKEPGFFSNELEYLLKGSMNEHQNVKSMRRKILGIRTILNMITLMQDEDKHTLIQTVAKGTGGLLIPGIGETVAYGLLLLGWSWWEAQEDWKQLSAGERIPLIKTREDWMTELDNLLNDTAEEEREKKTDTGLSYHQYAKFLLCLLSKETIETRLQDLIYLEKHGAILLNQYITGFSVQGTLQAGRQSYAFSGTYQY